MRATILWGTVWIMRNLRRSRLILLGALGLACAPVCAQETPVINEILARSRIDFDLDGVTEDVFELYYGGEQEYDLGGMYLTDDLSCPTRWMIPDGLRLGPIRRFATFYADRETHRPFHTGFRLDADGETLALIDRDGATVLDRVDYPAQFRDCSYGRMPDGGEEFLLLEETIGFENGFPSDPPPEVNISFWGAVREGAVSFRPSPGEPVVVRARVLDDNPGGLGEVAVVAEVAGEERIYPLRDDGKDPDEGLEDGIYAGSIPGLDRGTQVRFFVRARDEAGQVGTDPNPNEVPDQRITYVVGGRNNGGGPVLNEVLPKAFCIPGECTAAQLDPADSDPDDWVEIFNPGPEAISNLHEYFLTDNPTRPYKWKVLGGVARSPLGPGEFLRIWVDGETNQGLDHASFLLDADRDEILLVHPDHGVVDALSWEDVPVNVSVGRYPDASDGVCRFRPPTPGGPNGSVHSPPRVRLGLPGGGAGLGPRAPIHPVPPPANTPITVYARVAPDPQDPTGRIDAVTLLMKAPFERAIPMEEIGILPGRRGYRIFEGVLPGFSAGGLVAFAVQAVDGEGEASDPELVRYITGHYATVPVVLGEVMPTNAPAEGPGGLLDPDVDPGGQAEDWIEIRNSSAEAVDVGDLYLSQDLLRPTQWKIPSGTSIEAGGFLRIWAAGKDPNQYCPARLHASFRLDGGNGEAVYLFDRDGEGLVDALVFPPLPADVSFGRSGADPAQIGCLAVSTPGGPNASLVACPSPPVEEFRRGDANADGRFSLLDALTIFTFVPDELPCADAADADDDGAVTVDDAISILKLIFLVGTPPLPLPRECGPDPTRDDLPACGESACR